MMKRLFTVLTGVALAIVMLAAPSQAGGHHFQRHVSNFTADCNGVTLHADSYDNSKANKWSVTIGGVEQHGTFGSDFNQTFALPQSGATTSWSGHIEAFDGSYPFDGSGSVGPCGTPPPPPPPPPTCADTPSLCPPPPPPPPNKVKHVKTNVKIVDKCNCYRDKVTMLGGKHVTIKSSHP